MLQTSSSQSSVSLESRHRDNQVMGGMGGMGGLPYGAMNQINMGRNDLPPTLFYTTAVNNTTYQI